MERLRGKVTLLATIAMLFLFVSDHYSQNKQASQPRTGPLAKSAAVAKSTITAEEKLVRLAYKKLTVYSAVAKFQAGKKLNEIHDGREALRFKLSDFRSGKISELNDVLYDNVVSPPEGEIIQLVRATESMNDEEAQVMYKARWIPGQYATMPDRNWTISDVLKLETARYYDVTDYTSYRVEVSFEGKSRSYRALVLSHGDAKKRQIEFLDTVVGMGGTITSVWQDQYLPVGFRTEKEGVQIYDETLFSKKISDFLASEKNSFVVHGSGVSCPKAATTIDQCSIDPDLAVFWGVGPNDVWDPEFKPALPDIGENYSPNSSITWLANDYRGHNGTPGHYGWAQFAPRCVAVSTTQQRCEVPHAGPEYGDNADNHSDWWYHVGTARQQANPRTGPRGQDIQCETGVGVAFNTCVTSGCGVSMTLGISGQGANATVTISGGDLWSAGRAEGLTCNLPRNPGGGGGSCPT